MQLHGSQGARAGELQPSTGTKDQEPSDAASSAWRDSRPTRLLAPRRLWHIEEPAISPSTQGFRLQPPPPPSPYAKVFHDDTTRSKILTSYALEQNTWRFMWRFLIGEREGVAMTTASAGGGVLQCWSSGSLKPRKRIELNYCRSRGFLVGTPISKSTTNTSLLVGQRTGKKLRKMLPVSPVMEWQDCSAKIEVDVPASYAYDCYSDRESIPNWMTFISSVNVLKDKPDQSRWLLKYSVLGRDVEFSWMARNLQPIRNQKIHWRSLEGLPNRGAVRFFPKDPSSCKVELTVSYEIPQILSPVATALKPACERVLSLGLEKFAAYAEDSYQSKVV